VELAYLKRIVDEHLGGKVSELTVWVVWEYTIWACAHNREYARYYEAAFGTKPRRLDLGANFFHSPISRSRWQFGPHGIVVRALGPLSSNLRLASASTPISGRAHRSQCLNSDFVNSLRPPAARPRARSSFAFAGRNHTCRGSVPSP
jgi:hypothetical protein